MLHTHQQTSSPLRQQRSLETLRVVLEGRMKYYHHPYRHWSLWLVRRCNTWKGSGGIAVWHATLAGSLIAHPPEDGAFLSERSPTTDRYSPRCAVARKRLHTAAILPTSTYLNPHLLKSFPIFWNRDHSLGMTQVPFTFLRFIHLHCLSVCLSRSLDLSNLIPTQFR